MGDATREDRARRLRKLQRYGRARTTIIALTTGRTRKQVVTDGLRSVRGR